MKAILMSIQPQWCELIASGKKTVEVRKTAPKDTPFKVYIYQSKWHWVYKILPWLKERRGNVIGEFVCDKIEECIPDYNPVTQEFFYNEWADCSASCLTSKEEAEYGKGKPLKGLHISAVKIYDKPKALSEFRTIKCTNKRGSCSDCEIKPNCIKYLSRPPQSWQYVEVLK